MTAILDPLAVFLNSAADLTDRMSFNTMESLRAPSEVDGRISTLANGRERLILREGGRKSLELALVYLTREQTDWLEAHKGMLLCARDHTGRKFYGTYLRVDPAEDEWPGTDRVNTPITVRQLTHAEAVTA